MLDGGTVSPKRIRAFIFISCCIPMRWMQLARLCMPKSHEVAQGGHVIRPNVWHPRMLFGGRQGEDANLSQMILRVIFRQAGAQDDRKD